MQRPRRNHSAKFEASAALAAIRGGKNLVEPSGPHKGHPNRSGQWRLALESDLPDGAPGRIADASAKG